MACNFKIPFQIPPTEAVEKAKKAVFDQDGNFTGNEFSGQFDVTIFGNYIKGEYTVEGQDLNLTIIEKPIYLPCGMIEAFLKKEIS